MSCAEESTKERGGVAPIGLDHSPYTDLSRKWMMSCAEESAKERVRGGDIWSDHSPYADMRGWEERVRDGDVRSDHFPYTDSKPMSFRLFRSGDSRGIPSWS